jgi:AraC-like DNA-binding protein
MSKELYIKNMVCDRCILVVREELIKQGFHPLDIRLGVARIQEDEFDATQRERLAKKFDEIGFELLDGSKSRLIERIKTIIIEKVHHSNFLDDIKVNWSDLLSDQLHYEYSYLSNLFSSVEGITLEQYIIRQKIEKVKELLFNDELNLSEISYKLGYSSVQHLSTQFKKVTGQTPSQFKNSRQNSLLRKPLDSIS